MQATDASTLFQTDEALAVGAARASKAARTATGSEYGHPIWLGSRYKDATGLAESGAGADAGSARVLSLRCRTVPAVAASRSTLPRSQAWTAESGGVVRVTDLENGNTAALFRGHTAPVPAFDIIEVSASVDADASARQVLVTGSWDKSLKFWPVPGGAAQVAASASTSSRPPLRIKPLLTLPQAATDFIKAVHFFRSEGQAFLLSAGSDKTVRCWHLTPLLDWIAGLQDEAWMQICSSGITEEQTKAAPSVKVLATMREHTRPINCLSSVPPAPHSPSSGSVSTAEKQTTLFSADSMGRIFEMVLELPSSLSKESTASRASLKIRRELRGHETAIYDLRVGWRAEEIEGIDSVPADSATSPAASDEFATPIFEAEDGSFRRYVAEVWTSSGDKTARCFVLSPLAQSNKGLGLVAGSRTSKAGPPLGSQPALGPATTITHSDFVKSLVPVAHAGTRAEMEQLQRSNGAAVQQPPDVLATGSADETLRLFSLDQVAHAPTSSGVTKPRVAVEGHWHEIDAVDAWYRPQSGPLGPAPEQSEAGTEATGAAQPSAQASVAPGQGEWYVVSSGLDGSIRRWKVLDLLAAPPKATQEAASESTPATANTDKTIKQLAPSASASAAVAPAGVAASAKQGGRNPGQAKPQHQMEMTEDEERELAELMGSDDDDL